MCVTESAVRDQAQAAHARARGAGVGAAARPRPPGGEAGKYLVYLHTGFNFRMWRAYVANIRVSEPLQEEVDAAVAAAADDRERAAASRIHLYRAAMGFAARNEELRTWKVRRRTAQASGRARCGLGSNPALGFFLG